MLHLDFETRSRVDLIKEGAYRYAADPSTEIICLGWALDDGQVDIWTPDTPIPLSLLTFLKNPTQPIRAHNAQFERLICRYVLPRVLGVHASDFPVDRFTCTAYMARCNNLPGDLEGCARALGVRHQKDMRGKTLIQQLCIPRSDGTFNKNPELLAEMYDYCTQDVRTERSIERMMREPTDEEWQDYVVSELINDQGVRIDREFASHAAQLADEETEDLRQQVEDVTDGDITKVRGEGLKAWVYARLDKGPRALMERKKVREDGETETKIVLDKAVRGRLLACELDADVRLVLESSDLASRSSVSKYAAMLDRASDDDRVRGAFIANGASASGRFSARGLQLHNFPRDVYDDPDAVRNEIVDAVANGYLPGLRDNVMKALSRMLRATLIPGPGQVFLVSDWSAIEGCCAPWLTGLPEGERKLDIYRSGEDVYSVTFAEMYGRPPNDKDERQIGKVAELSLQYQGGYRAFQSMAANYGVKMSDADAEDIKHRWREANPWAVRLWEMCQGAAYEAFRHPGEVIPAGRVKYVVLKDKIVGAKTMFCELPCGRLLTYPDVRMEVVEGAFGDQFSLTCMRSAFRPKVGEKEWPRSTLYGGLLTENITQGTAASILRHALRECDRHMLPVVAHVHDEIIVEVGSRPKHVDTMAAIFHTVMNTPPAWAEGLPLKASVEVMHRYGK